MSRYFFQRLSLGLFLLYLALFPGSTLAVALDHVPAGGAWLGGALLLLQGAIVLCWLIGNQGRRGMLIALLVFLIAWAVEHVGVTTGVPFGRYYYTDALQPQLLGVVPLAITCAWLMVAVGAWQLTTTENREPRTENREPRTENREIANGWRKEMRAVLLAATLILLLDLQIETIATAINRYWVWVHSGPYYGVPTANFVSWWLVGIAMAFVISRVSRRMTTDRRPTTNDQRPGTTSREQRTKGKAPRTENREPRTQNREPRTTHHSSLVTRYSSLVTRCESRIQPALPAYLYMFSTLMFAVVNLAQGYVWAGLIGLGVLLAAALTSRGGRRALAIEHAARQITD